MPKRNPGERWRYIAFRVEGGKSFTRSDFLNALLQKSRQRALDDAFRITPRLLDILLWSTFQ